MAKLRIVATRATPARERAMARAARRETINLNPVVSQTFRYGPVTTLTNAYAGAARPTWQ
jgi:hypothetical protein